MLLGTFFISSFSFGVLIYKSKNESLSHLLLSILSSLIYGAILFFLAYIATSAISIISNFILMMLLVVPVYYLVWSLFHRKHTS